MVLAKPGGRCSGLCASHSMSAIPLPTHLSPSSRLGNLHPAWMVWWTLGAVAAQDGPAPRRQPARIHEFSWQGQTTRTDLTRMDSYLSTVAADWKLIAWSLPWAYRSQILSKKTSNPGSAIDLLPEIIWSWVSGPMIYISDRFWRAYSLKHGLIDDLTFSHHPFLSSRMCRTLCEGLEPCQLLYQSNHQIRILRLKNPVSSQGPTSDFWWGRSQFVKL